ncbi:hypothetical protein ACFUJU_19685 [Streptomyces sp. NPDC057235]|uniref:hypothetical protein n=1 Tax=Streptomyces sp. NPDC057235 TaxID=3346058 RepID=UPI00364369FB
MPDLVAPEKSSPARFGMVRTFGAFHVTEQASLICQFTTFEQEVALPVESHELIFSPGPIQPLLSSVRWRSFPVQRDGVKVLVRRTGAADPMLGSRPLPIGLSVEAAGMITSRAAAPFVHTARSGGVRFGVYIGPMTKMTSVLAVSAAAVSAVGR